MKYRSMLGVLVVGGSLLCATVAAEAVNVVGKVTDAAGNAVPGALVTLTGAGLSDSTDADGNFTISGQAPVAWFASPGRGHDAPYVSRGVLFVPVDASGSEVRIALVTSQGRLLADRSLFSPAAGTHALDLRGLSGALAAAPGAAFLRTETGGRTTSHRMALLSDGEILCEPQGWGEAMRVAGQGLGRRSALDELLVKKTGFLRKRVPVGSYAETLASPIVLGKPEGAADHSMRIIFPNGGETFRVGDTVVIEVDADPADGWRAVLEWSWDAGKNWVAIVEEHFETPGIVTYAIPDSLTWVTDEAGQVVVRQVSTLSAESLVKAYEYESHNVNDRSDAAFTVLP